MIGYNEILGRPVLTIREGKDLGKVSKALVDTDEGRVIGFVLKDKYKKEGTLFIESIDTYGVDAIMVQSEEKVKSISEAPEKKEVIELGRDIIGLKIVTKTGKEVGKVSSFHFKNESGAITHYEASGGLLQSLIEGKGLVSQDGIVSIGKDALIVEEAAIKISEKMKVAPGLKHAAAKIKAKTAQTADKAAEKLKEKTEDVIKAGPEITGGIARAKDKSIKRAADTVLKAKKEVKKLAGTLTKKKSEHK
jgi:uncharacterized protein YrrD